MDESLLVRVARPAPSPDQAPRAGGGEPPDDRDEIADGGTGRGCGVGLARGTWSGSLSWENRGGRRHLTYSRPTSGGSRLARGTLREQPARANPSRPVIPSKDPPVCGSVGCDPAHAPAAPAPRSPSRRTRRWSTAIGGFNRSAAGLARTLARGALKPAYSARQAPISNPRVAGSNPDKRIPKTL
jgi:hypothetical protein